MHGKAKLVWLAGAAGALALALAGLAGNFATVSAGQQSAWTNPTPYGVGALAFLIVAALLAYLGLRGDAQKKPNVSLELTGAVFGAFGSRQLARVQAGIRASNDGGPTTLTSWTLVVSIRDRSEKGEHVPGLDELRAEGTQSLSSLDDLGSAPFQGERSGRVDFCLPSVPLAVIQSELDQVELEISAKDRKGRTISARQSAAYFLEKYGRLEFGNPTDDLSGLAEQIDVLTKDVSAFGAERTRYEPIHASTQEVLAYHKETRALWQRDYLPSIEEARVDAQDAGVLLPDGLLHSHEYVMLTGPNPIAEVAGSLAALASAVRGKRRTT